MGIFKKLGSIWKKVVVDTWKGDDSGDLHEKEDQLQTEVDAAWSSVDSVTATEVPKINKQINKH